MMSFPRASLTFLDTLALAAAVGSILVARSAAAQPGEPRVRTARSVLLGDEMSERPIPVVELPAGSPSADVDAEPLATDVRRVAPELAGRGPTSLRSEDEPSASTGPRLSFGIQSGVNDPLGPLGLFAAFYPIRELGLEAGCSLPGLGTPTTFTEMVIVEWRQAVDFLRQGVGVGLSQSLIPRVGPVGRGGVVTYLQSEVGHLTFVFSRSLALRVAGGMGVAISGNDFCEAHPDACGHATFYGYFNTSLAFSIGLGGDKR